jgi:hypothetical protein
MPVSYGLAEDSIETVWECDFSTLPAEDWLGGGVKTLAPTAGSNSASVGWTVANTSKSADLGPNGSTGIDLQNNGTANDVWVIPWTAPLIHAAIIDLVPDYGLGDTLLAVLTVNAGALPGANHQGCGVGVLDGSDGFAMQARYDTSAKAAAKQWVGGVPSEDKTLASGALDYVVMLLSGGSALVGSGTGAPPAWGAGTWWRSLGVSPLPSTTPPVVNLATSRLYLFGSNGNTATTWAPTIGKVSILRLPRLVA